MSMPASILARIRDRSSVLNLTAAMLALSAWLAAHPFWGILHDNKLYVVQALNYNDSSVLSGDLFLKFGSQDSFTVFSPIYGTFIRIVGLDMATKMLAAVGHGMWLVAALALIRTIVPRPLVWPALLLLAIYPASYGGLSVFNVGEGFVTPRLFSEALSIGAVAAFLNGRRMLMLILLLAGVVLHPLMVAGPVAVLLVMAVSRGRSWWAPLVITGLASLLAIMALVIHQLAGMSVLASIDAEWKHLAVTRSPHLLIGKWYGADWKSLCADLILVFLGMFNATPLVRQLFVSTAAVSAAGIALSFVGFDLMDYLFIGQVQFWRAAWFLAILAPIGLTLVIRDASDRKTPDKVLLTLALGVAMLGAVESSTGLNSVHFSATLLLSLAYLSSMRTEADPKLLRFVNFMLLVSLGLVCILVIRAFYPIFTLAFLSSDPLYARRMMLARAMLPLGLAAMGCLLILRPRFSQSTAWALVVAVMFCISAANWSRQSDWRRYVDSAPDINQQLSRPIAPHETVSWSEDVMVAWAALGRQSFFSTYQGSGLIFNRETAIEYFKRLSVVRALAPLGENLDGDVFSKTQPGLSDLAATCRQSIHPDVIVLEYDIAGVKHERWRAPVGKPSVVKSMSPDGTPVFQRQVVWDFYFYRCKDVVR